MISDNLEKPLVTFALFAYNQERFIREAVEGALAQTYSPLQVILSDDCSSDRTFEIMQEMAAEYLGPHNIRLNKNIQNFGIAGHINTVMSIIGTDFVIVAAGDDISLPERTTTLVNEWINSGRRAKSIYSLAERIDLFGNSTNIIVDSCNIVSLNKPFDHARFDLWVLGAAHAWDMQIIRLFPKLSEKIVNEDIVLPARAAILGEVRKIPIVLVKYRFLEGANSKEIEIKNSIKFKTKELFRRRYYTFVQKSIDYKHIGIYDQYKLILQKRRSEYLLQYWLAKEKKLSLKKIKFFFKRSSLFFFGELFRLRFPFIIERVRIKKTALKSRLLYLLKILPTNIISRLEHVSQKLPSVAARRLLTSIAVRFGKPN